MKRRPPESASASASAGAVSQTEKTTIKICVLLVDDGPMNLRLYEKALETALPKMNTAESPYEFELSITKEANVANAIDSLEKSLPQIIVSDYEMPGGNGDQLFAALFPLYTKKSLEIPLVFGCTSSPEQNLPGFEKGAAGQPFILLTKNPGPMRLEISDALTALSEGQDKYLDPTTHKLLDSPPADTSRAEAPAASSRAETPLALLTLYPHLLREDYAAQLRQASSAEQTANAALASGAGGATLTAPPRRDPDAADAAAADETSAPDAGPDTGTGDPGKGPGGGSTG
jgi:CheY-like chemotaxis protein